MRHVQFICKFSPALLFTLSTLNPVLLLTLLILNGTAYPAQASFQALWSQIVNSPPPAPVRRGGSRGGYFCQIAPEREGAVWSDRPTLVWKGSVARVELVTDDLETTLWSKDTGGVTNQVQQQTGQ
jgi:hypothetical protein